MKKCDRCGSEISVDAKQCPHCKRWFWDKKSKRIMKVLGVICGILFLILIFIIVAMSTTIDCTDSEMVVIRDIYKETSANKPRALDLYDGKYYRLEGKVFHIYDGYVQIDDENSEYSVMFYYTSEYNEEVKKLEIGDKITFCGKLNNDVFGAWNVKDGCIIKVEE